MDTLQIGSRREVCWDELLIDTAEGVSVQMHRPQYKGVAMELGELWEGNGNYLDGYDSGKLFGDSVDRRVYFTKPLAELSGKEIRMEISMKDADLYAFQFDTDVRWGGK